MSGLCFHAVVHIWIVSGISLSSCPKRARLGMSQSRRPQEHSCSHLWLFLFPLAGFLGHWDCVWGPSRGVGDAHSWLAVASHSFCPPTFALRCPVLCRYSFKESIYRFSTWFRNPIKGNRDSFELSVETFEIMTKMLLIQQGTSENIPVSCVYVTVFAGGQWWAGILRNQIRPGNLSSLMTLFQLSSVESTLY